MGSLKCQIFNWSEKPEDIDVTISRDELIELQSSLIKNHNLVSHSKFFISGDIYIHLTSLSESSSYILIGLFIK